MKTTILQPAFRRVRGIQSGSALLAALGILAVTFIAVGAALFEASNRFRTSHHSSRWTQAVHAAEAGAEIGVMTAQKNSWVADGWTGGAPGAPGAAAVTKTITLSTGVPATGPVSTTVAVDKVTMGGTQWLRVRSTGIADVSGGARAGIDAQDGMLRKLSLRKDRATGLSVATPRATRTIEVLAQPLASNPFKFTFFSKQLFDIHANTTSDSYDSSSAAKSNFTPFTTYGIYDATKKQNNGDVGTLDTAQWNFNMAHVWGDALTPGGNVAHATNIHGTVQSGFTFTFPTEVAPVWPVVTQNHGVVSNVSKALTGGTQASPTLHKFTSIELTSSNRSIVVANPAGQTESWVELWVTGDVKVDRVSGAGIRFAAGVHATVHFGAKVEIKGGSGGYGLDNQSKLPAHLIVKAYGGSSGANQDLMIAYTDFWGVVSAPWYKVKFDMAGKHVHGSFLAWQFDASDGTNLHYDEALGNLPYGGTGSGWKVKSWVEAVR